MICVIVWAIVWVIVRGIVWAIVLVVFEAVSVGTPSE